MSPMASSRKRTIRLAIALGVAVVLAGALIYTSFDAATEARQPSQVLAAARSGKTERSTYELTGRVVNGSIDHRGEALQFNIQDRKGGGSVPVLYRGEVPDPFRDGREVIVTGRLQQGVFVARRDSLVTKCPSKFTKAHSS
jgi:cytochrome c-type biogenesis protein CcmE